MTPEQPAAVRFPRKERSKLHQLVIAYAEDRETFHAIQTYVDSLLAAERAAVVAECEAVARRRAVRSTLAKNIADDIRKLGEKRE